MYVYIYIYIYVYSLFISPYQLVHVGLYGSKQSFFWKA